MTSYSYDEEPKKHKAELSARDRKIDYLEELVRVGIDQQKKWQKKAFENRAEADDWKKQCMEWKAKYDMEVNNRTKGISREDMQ